MAMSHLNLRVSFALALSALLLTIFSIVPQSHPRADFPGQYFGARSVAEGPDYASVSEFKADNTDTANVTSVALVFGGRRHISPFSGRRNVHRKRASQTYTYAVCKGQKLYQAMKDSYQNPTSGSTGQQGSEFEVTDLDNGWTRRDETIGDSFGDEWEDARELMAMETGRSPTDLKKLRLVQDRTFTAKAGNTVSQIQDMTGAFYSCAYSVRTSLIIASDTESPTSRLKRGDPSITDDEIARRIPPLNRLSDAMWTVWKDLSGDNIQNARLLRYIGRSNVVNDDSKAIMQKIFTKAKSSETVPWPGLTYTMYDEQGQALLGTPNGIATAYLLIDHHTILGPRDPRVTIWTYEATPSDSDASGSDDDDVGGSKIEYYMLWDMGDPNVRPPLTPPAKSSSAGSLPTGSPPPEMRHLPIGRYGEWLTGPDWKAAPPLIVVGDG
ncbi:MAG: hypothetical protein LQ352_007904 [Teloschistes flavicans]|nr:MAG: hypothetical protein LQ352_007904 [Teloschistes flavicans]